MSESRIPSLDGWRGISIILVVLGHQMNIFRSGLTHNPAFLNIFELHNYGVQVFFVLSGFLITNLLINENNKYGAISLHNFYMRRLFRIIPAYFTFLITVFILSLFFHNHTIQKMEWVKAFLFLSNFAFWGKLSWSLGHTWSLSVEEQYYIIWPTLFRKKNFVWVPLFFICLAPVSRMISYSHSNIIGHFSFFSHVDSIFWGALFALNHRKPVFEKFLRFRYPILLITLILMGLERFSVGGTAFITVPFVKTFFSLSIIILIHQSLQPGSALYRFFNLKPLAFIGVLSYSIYLWQQIFYPISILGKCVVTTMPVNFIMIFGCAYVSYTFIEQPFLRLRSGFMKKHSSTVDKSSGRHA